MRYVMLLIVAFMVGPMSEAMAANSAPNLPSVWLASDGGQGYPMDPGPQGVALAKAAMWSPDPEISARGKSIMGDMLDDLEAARLNGYGRLNCED